MLNCKFEGMNGDSNKSNGKMNFKIQCKRLAVEYDSCGGHDKVANVRGKLDLEDFVMEGECEASMSGFFKLIGEMSKAGN